VRRATLLLISLVVITGSTVARGQPLARLAKIGWLSTGSIEVDASLVEGLRAGLKELGYAENKHFAIESRITGGAPERLGDAARELVGLNVDVIVASGDQGALAAKRATGSIPIVVHVADAIGIGLVKNMARPGGNITGFNDLHADLVPKRLELLKEISPRLSRATFISNPANPTCAQQSRQVIAAAPSFGISMSATDIRGPRDIEPAFRAMAKARTEAFIVCGDRMLGTHRQHIYGLAAKHRLLGMYANRRFVDSGGLMSYGSNLTDVYRGLAIYLDKILKGSRPGDLPMQQPTKFEIALNLRAAKAIGFSIPDAMRLRADYVID
jgi:putative ABC transport system substrate-binding protein